MVFKKKIINPSEIKKKKLIENQKFLYSFVLKSVLSKNDFREVEAA